MADGDIVTDSGIVSLSGFAYQIKVFIMLLSEIQINQQVEFETLDDVAINSIPKENEIEDYCIKRQYVKNGGIKIFQVKQTKVTSTICRKVLYNWLLALDKEANISEFVLYVQEGYSVDECAFNDNADIEYKKIMDSTKLPTALISRVKILYQDADIKKFVHDYDYICKKWSCKRLKNIDHSIWTNFAAVFHEGAHLVGPVYYQKRIEELFMIICSRIMKCASERTPYCCKQNEFMQLCEEICDNISPTNYAPDYNAFNQVHSLKSISEDVLKSREYQQLKYCDLDVEDIVSHLGWAQYYQDIRKHYLQDMQQGKIEKTEDIAYQNYRNVVLELCLNNEDKPLLRLLKTKKCEICTLTDQYTLWGVYVYLTSDGITHQISWKEVDNGNGET